jgi:hypothetical protein
MQRRKSSWKNEKISKHVVVTSYKKTKKHDANCHFNVQSHQCKDCDSWGDCALKHREQFQLDSEVESHGY